MTPPKRSSKKHSRSSQGSQTKEPDLGAATDKIRRLLQGLDSSFVERSTHVRVTLLSILAGHHVLLLGPPGTAKSLLARSICSCFAGAEFFEYLLSKFTHPDEIFGPVSIPGLKEEDYRRLTKGYLPSAHIAFLDEIFKANSAILNSLLTLINERIFHHGKHRDRVPLLGLIGASNEPPDPEGGLAALHDRFLTRLTVPPIAGSDNFLKVCLGEAPAFHPAKQDRLTRAEIRGMQRRARSVAAGKECKDALLGIRDELIQAGVPASDRRWRWAVELLQMSAASSGRDELSYVDLVLLEHCFGDSPAEKATVSRCVRELVGGSLRGDAILTPLAQTWAKHNEAPLPDTFEAWRASAHATSNELSFACKAVRQHLNEFKRGVDDAVSTTPWITEPPPELLARITSSRSRILSFEKSAAKFARSVAAYDPLKAILSGKVADGPNYHFGFGYNRSTLLVIKSSERAVLALDEVGEPHRLGTTHHASEEAYADFSLSKDNAYRLLCQGSPKDLASSLSAAIASRANKEAKNKRESTPRSAYHPHHFRHTQIQANFATKALENWIQRLRAHSDNLPPRPVAPSFIGSEKDQEKPVDKRRGR